MKRLLNYTTQISAEKTISEIQKILASAGARAILTEYGDDGVLVAISFRVMTQHGLMAFKIPANTHKVLVAIQQNSKIPKWNRTHQQAARVAWRIIKDWVEAQMAMIQTEMVTLDQLFLPYAQRPDGVTVYETMVKSKFQGLALPEARS